MKIIVRTAAAVAAITSLVGVAPLTATAAPSHSILAQAKPKTSPFPTTVITNLKTGKSATLTSFAKVKTPVLVWFWAPH